MTESAWGNGLPLLPQPAYAARTEGEFMAEAGKPARLRMNPALGWLADEIAEEWRRRFGVRTEIVLGAAEDWSWEIGSSDAAGEGIEQVWPEQDEGEEAYALRVSRSGIQAEARGYRGAMYAWFTLKQWLMVCEAREGIPGLTVRDRPALARRGVHFDLKGAVPNAAYVSETIARLASFKINALLIEYEDQFAFAAAAPGVHKPGGMTAEQRTAMLDCARRYGMETIPVLNCLGHADYVLKDDAYAGLRENGLLSQYCPTHPGTFGFIRAMIDEIAAVHSDSEFIHIGADEAWALGSCERCRAAVADSPPERAKADLYLRYVGRVAEYVLSIGKRPIVWDDMFHSEKCVERIAELPQGTAVCSWSYYEFDRPSPWFWYGGRYYASDRWRNRDPGAAPGFARLEDLPPEESEVVRRWWDEGEFPDCGVSAVPWIRHYREQGYEVIGASCARGADFINQWSAYPEDRVRNVRFWARYAAEAGLSGTIASAWTRFYSLAPPVEHWESGWYPVVAQGAFGWRPETDETRYDALFEAVFLAGDADAAAGMHWLRRGLETREETYFGRKIGYLRAAAERFEAAARRGDDVGRYAEGMRLAALYEAAVLSLENGLKQNEWRLYYKGGERYRPDRDYMVGRDMRGLRAAMALAAEWEAAALAYCGSFMRAGEAEELVLSKLYAYKLRYERLTSELGTTAI